MNLSEKLKDHFPEEMIATFQAAAEVGQQQKQSVALVGGVVRDMVLGRSVGDADIMVEHPAKPLVQDLVKRLNAELVSHERFFTFTMVLPSGRKIDIVTAREEVYSAPAKLPDVTPSTLEQDLKRRDFTANAIACFLSHEGKGESFGELLDPFNGLADIKKRTLKALHNKSFVDDPTRIFRCARFAGRLGFDVETSTEAWIKDSIKQKIPNQLTPVRRRHEFEMILKEANPTPALLLLKKWDVMSVLHPEWGAVKEEAFRFASPADLLERLVEWFQPWGKVKAQAMMTDLSFEKIMKTQVLSKLVQSSTI